MSGVYIPGMKMPKSCEKCPCKAADAFGGLGCQATGYIPLRKANQDRPDNCPLVPVPDHGPLIDADKLIAEHNGIFDNCCFPSDIRAAPVLIPADGEDAGG